MRRLVLALLLACGAAPPLAVQAVENLGAHRFGGMEEFQRVIETRCTVCHTRERVDLAIKQRESLEAIQQRMLQRGAALSENEKEVLGTFWGSPLKEQEPLPAHTR
jgi:hypothetical protein